MSRLPIRVRLTVAFAAAMVLVLAGACAFVAGRLSADLGETIDADLQVRANVAVASARGPGRAQLAGSPALAEPDESFAQILSPSGTVLDAAGGARGPAVTPAEARRAAAGTLTVERSLPGVDGPARVRAVPVGVGGRIAVVGQSLETRQEAVSNVVSSFAVGGAIAVAVASAIGFGLASAAFRPVEAMRRRAAEVSLRGGEEALPLPAARDEIRRLGDTLNEMLARLRDSFERERQFVADASHELRTPIAVITTEVGTALRDPGLSPDAREALAAAAEECDHLGQLAEDLLVLARAQDGALPIRAEVVPAGPLVTGVRDRYARRAAARGRSIEATAPEGATAWGDPLRLRQALSNLVDNALRHGAGEVRVAAAPQDGGIVLAVSDTGPGFDPELAPHAFERFARGTAARGERGSGLGLAIVRTIAEAHGGRAEIVPGPGGEVRLWLPGRAEA